VSISLKQIWFLKLFICMSSSFEHSITILSQCTVLKFVLVKIFNLFISMIYFFILLFITIIRSRYFLAIPIQSLPEACS
jgi:hypothetical protein